MNRKFDPEPFRKAYETIAKQIRQTYEDPGIDGDFYNKTWKKFDPAYNLVVLTSELSTYPLRREITFDALCAWMIEPNSPLFVQTAISSSVARHMSLLESDTAELATEVRFFSDMVFRVSELGPDFFKEIYFPIGGLSAIGNTMPLADIKKYYRSKKHDLDRIILMLTILHHGALRFTDESTYKSISKKIAIESISAIGSTSENITGVSQRAAGPLWNEYEPSMVLLYAADKVFVPPGAGREPASLLDAILSGYGSRYSDAKTINELVRKAAYFKDLLVKKSHKEFSNRIIKLELPISTTERISPESIDGVTLEDIETHFRRKTR